MREFFHRYRHFLLAVALLLSTLLLYSYNLRQKGATTFFERAVLTLAAPFQTGIDASVDYLAGLWKNYLWLIDARQRNLQLEKENQELRASLRQVEEIRLQNERLRQLLAFVDELDLPALPAQVIGEDSSSWARTVIVDKWSRAGLRDGLPVVSAAGVVGRVLKTAPNSARVLLITDASSAVAALVQRTRTRGVAHGLGATLSLDYALRSADIVEGDLLVTSGMGGIFPKGLTLGRVNRVKKDQYGLFQEVKVTPAADFSHLEEVLIILGEDE
jgi:rod shape-determining protein MreC